MWRFRLIRFRLTLIYTLLLTGAFALFSVGIFVGLNKVLNDDFYNRLNDAASNVVKDSKVTATWSARPFCAATAVRTLARTHTFMPMKPAAPDTSAPPRTPPACRSRSAAGSRASSSASGSSAMTRLGRFGGRPATRQRPMAPPFGS